MFLTVSASNLASARWVVTRADRDERGRACCIGLDGGGAAPGGVVVHTCGHAGAFG